MLRTNQIAGFITVPSWKKIIYDIIYEIQNESFVKNENPIKFNTEVQNPIVATTIIFVALFPLLLYPVNLLCAV